MPLKPGHINPGTVLVLALFAALATCALVAEAYSEWMALLVMIVAGIPHGSFDLRIARLKWRSSIASRRVIVVGYTACVIAMSSLCIVAPPLGLALFLIVSALHFTEGEAQSTAPADALRGSLYGIGAILIPIGFHLRAAGEYMGFFLSPTLFESIQGVVEISSYTLATIITFTLIYDMLGQKKSQMARSTTIERLVCFIGWIVLSPLAGFAVWFIGRHSRQHLEVCKGIFSEGWTDIPLDFLLISLVAIAGLIPFTLLFDLSDINQLFAASISLIAGLTLPHMVVSRGLRELGEG